MDRRFIFVAVTFVTLSFPVAAAKQAAAATQCYRAGDPVACFIDHAVGMLGRVAAPDDRADAVAELLYTLSFTQTRNEAVFEEARRLADNRAVKPVKQVDLLYAIDLYASSVDSGAKETFISAVRRFAVLERELEGDARIELYVSACSIIAWDDALRARWLEFAQSACTPEKLRVAGASGGAAHKALVLTMMPVAMTLAENLEGFAVSADSALSWLQTMEQSARKSKNAADKDFIAYVGVLMHTMNSFCLDLFDLPDASDAEIDRAYKVLRGMEKRVGISARSTFLRRQVVESMFDTGREAEATKMLRQMLSRVDADSQGKKIPFGEQIAIALLAARLAYEEQAELEQTCVPDERIRM